MSGDCRSHSDCYAAVTANPIPLYTWPVEQRVSGVATTDGDCASRTMSRVELFESTATRPCVLQRGVQTGHVAALRQGHRPAEIAVPTNSSVSPMPALGAGPIGPPPLMMPTPPPISAANLAGFQEEYMRMQQMMQQFTAMSQMVNPGMEAMQQPLLALPLGASGPGPSRVPTLGPTPQMVPPELPVNMADLTEEESLL